MEVVSRILEETSFDGVANVAAQYLNAIDQSSAYTAAEHQECSDPRRYERGVFRGSVSPLPAYPLTDPPHTQALQRKAWQLNSLVSLESFVSDALWCGSTP